MQNVAGWILDRETARLFGRAPDPQGLLICRAITIIRLVGSLLFFPRRENTGRRRRRRRRVVSGVEKKRTPLSQRGEKRGLGKLRARCIRLLSLCRMRAAGGVAIADERPVYPLSSPLFLSRRRPMHFDRIIGRSGATSPLLRCPTDHRA